MSSSERNTIYDLYGIIVHQGSSRQFGHYYSYCRGFESKDTWYKCNDESTTKLNGPGSIQDKQAYILFYQARHSLVNRKDSKSSSEIENNGPLEIKIKLE